VMMKRFCVAMNLPTTAPSQYLDYDFNSMCTFHGIPLAGGEDGIFQLDSGGGNDGDPIQAWFKLVTTDFGIQNLKRVRKMTLGYETSGGMLLTVTADEKRSREYPLYPLQSDETEHGNTVSGARDVYGRYWSFKVENVGGSDFSIDAISVVPIILNRNK
jgi:hypothetical protein